MELYYVETNGDKSMTRKRVSVSRYFVIKLLMCEKVSVFFFIIINIFNTAIHWNLTPDYEICKDYNI